MNVESQNVDVDCDEDRHEDKSENHKKGVHIWFYNIRIYRPLLEASFKAKDKHFI